MIHNKCTTCLLSCFDPPFKSLKVVENYVGHGACIRLVVEYDANEIVPLLMIVFEVLNPIVQTCVVKSIGFVVMLLWILFDLVTLLKKTIIYLVWVHLWKSPLLTCCWKLSLFKRLFVTLTTCVDPLAWW
jgi:hypothetical protein